MKNSRKNTMNSIAMGIALSLGCAFAYPGGTSAGLQM